MERDSESTCETVLRRLDDYLDDELSLAELREVQAHLAQCVPCAARFAAEGVILRAVRAKLQRVAAPAHLLARVSIALDQVQLR
jgi:anti-sigma factor (TIGR02949 family)